MWKMFVLNCDPGISMALCLLHRETLISPSSALHLSPSPGSLFHIQFVIPMARTCVKIAKSQISKKGRGRRVWEWREKEGIVGCGTEV